jgi:hypothetical protein
MKRIIDLLRQISLAAAEIDPRSSVSQRSLAICEVLNRGVVAYSNLE